MISYKDKGKDCNYEKIEGKIWQKRRLNRKWGTGWVCSKSGLPEYKGARGLRLDDRRWMVRVT